MQRPQVSDPKGYLIQALSQPWSDGQITKLRLGQPQIHGSGKLDLLFVGATAPE
jgi:hypothetical protein